MTRSISTIPPPPSSELPSVLLPPERTELGAPTRVPAHVVRVIPASVAAPLLLLHGFALAGIGTWLTERWSAWLLVPTWMVAMLGLVGAGFGLLGIAGLRERWRPLALVGALAAIPLAWSIGGWLMLAGMLMDVGAAILALSEGARTVRTRHRVLDVLAWLLLGWLALLLAARPWHLRWGSTAAERAMALPGDGLVPIAGYRMDHVVTIHAPADSVWPWLAQIGQDRGGFYSYSGLERLIGDPVRNADRVHPEWQSRRVGDLVPATPPDYLGGMFGRSLGWRVAEIVPGRALVLANWGAFVVRPVNDSTSRLHIRMRGPGQPSLAGVVLAPLGLLVFEPAHFIMERGMLLGIRRRAEGMMRRVPLDDRWWYWVEGGRRG